VPHLTEKQVLDLTRDLPAVSTIALQLVSLIDNPNTTRDQVAHLVAQDEYLFAQCFKHANSAAISSLRELKTIQEILDILGFSYIKKAALFVSAKSIIADPTVWFDSVFIAVAAEYLAKRSGLSVVDSDQIYMAGLFQNYGAFVLKATYPKIYAKVTQVKDFKIRMQSEQEEFAWTYPSLSAFLLKAYGLPEKVIKILESQDQVYTNRSQKENIYIEIGRVFCEFEKQKLDFELVCQRLELDDIRDLVLNSGIAIAKIDVEDFKKIRNNVAEFTGSNN
jgi:HD-like signal output (HDOD) protein